MPLSTSPIVAEIAASVAPAVGVGIACLIAFVSTVWTFRSMLQRMVVRVEDDKKLKANAAKFGFAGAQFGNEWDAQEYIENANEDFEAEERREANEQGWFDHYTQEAIDRGMTYEEAAEATMHTSRQIGRAREYLRDGYAVHDAIELSRYFDEDEDLFYASMHS